MFNAIRTKTFCALDKIYLLETRFVKCKDCDAVAPIDCIINSGHSKHESFFNLIESCAFLEPFFLLCCLFYSKWDNTYHIVLKIT